MFNRLFKLELNGNEYCYLFTENELCGTDIKEVIDTYKDKHNGIDDDERFIEYFKLSDESVKYIKNDIIDTKQIESLLKEPDSTSSSSEETPIERRLKAMKKVNKKKYDDLFNRWGMSKREDGYKGTFEEFAEEQLNNDEEDEV